MAKLRSLFKSDFPEKEINRLAIPAIIASCAEPVISLCDTAIIGHFSQEEDVALGAAGLSTTFFLSIIWIFSQTRTAMSALLSRYYGEKKLNDIKTLVPQMIMLNFAVGVVIFLFTLNFARPIFEMYNANGQLLDSTVSYFSIRCIGFPFVLSTVLIFGVFRGVQDTFWAMLISIIGGTINITLDYLLMGGIKGYIEPMGVNGVAISSVIAQITMFILAIFLLYKKTNFTLNFFAKPHPDMFKLFELTGNLVIRSLAVQTAYFFSSRFAAGYGAHYFNVQTVFWNIWLFSAFFIEGYSSAGNALSGKYFGAKNMEMLWRMSDFMWRRTLLIGIGLGSFFMLVYPWAPLLFLKNDQEIQLFYSVFWLVALVQPFMAIAFTYDELLKGLSRMAYLRDTLIIATFLGFVPAIFLFDYIGFGLHSVWAAFICWMIFRGTRLRREFIRSYSY